MQSHAGLPDDIEALKAMVRERDAIIATHTSEIEQLKLLIAKLKRMRFGRQSEKLDHQIEQLELRLEDLQADESQAASQIQEPNRTVRKQSTRKPLPEHLPREEKCTHRLPKPVLPVAASCAT
jgi:chromosome segregation ATPase